MAAPAATVCPLTTLLLVRHGETDWNRDRRWQGHTGPPLNAAGRRQARALARTLPAVTAVYASDVERTIETAVLLAAPHRLEVTREPRLREINFGRWEGLTRAEIEARFGDWFASWLAGERTAPEGGESDAAMAERVFAALDDIAERHHGERVLVVTSGGPIRSVQARLRGIDPLAARRLVEAVSHCSLVELSIRDGAWLA